MNLFAGHCYPRIPKSISVTLVAVLILNSLLFALIFQPHEAKAQFTDPVNAVLQPIQIQIQGLQANEQGVQLTLDTTANAKTGLFQIWDQFKSSNGIIAELVSSLLLVMMHQVLAKITNDIVAWINGGGKGKIRVLQDPGKFLTDAVDEAGGVLAGAILNVDPKTLCDASYLKFKLKAAFTGPYAVPTFDEKVACTFTGAAEGLKRFQENFANGGWASFVELSRKENNQIGQTLIAADELNTIESEKSAESAAKLNISKGFLAQEKCTITKLAPNDQIAKNSGALGMDTGKAMQDFNFSDEEEFKKWWTENGGEFKCKTVTPAEQISGLANEALQAPIKTLQDSITGLTSKLGTGAGSVIKPYVLAIAGAGLNLLLNKEVGLISGALQRAQKPRKNQRQVTSSLQEHTMLAQSAGALAGSVTSFRSFLLKAIIDFSIFVDTSSEAIARMDVLGRIPINKVETETRGGTWYLTYNNARPPSPSNNIEGMKDCPPGYLNSGVLHPCNGDLASDGVTHVPPAPDGPMTTLGNRVYTNPAGKVFFDEARWCGAFSQEVPIPVNNPNAVVTAPVVGSDPIPFPTTWTCPPPIPGTTSSDCSISPWVQYKDGAGTTIMATRIMAYDDKETGMADRFIRENIVGADTNNDGIPDGAVTTADPVTFSETLINTRQDVNHNSVVDDATTTPAGLSGLFKMHPYYSTTPASVGPGLAQAAVASSPAPAAETYIIGGYNQFGFSHRVIRVSTGTASTIPLAVAGSAAVYYPPNGRIYIFGGFNDTAAYNTIWEYNPANGTVKTMSARLPSPATGISAVYYPPTGRIYLFGGNNNGTISNQILEYNQTTDTLVTKNAKLTSPLAFTAAAIGGTGAGQRIYVFGGFDDHGFSSATILKYNPSGSDDSSALVRQSTNIDPARGFVAAVQDPLNLNYINVYGGQNEFGYVFSTERYNTQTDSLAPSTPLPGSLSKAGVTPGGALLGGIIPATDPESAKIFPQGDIYYIPAHIDSVSVTMPFWQKYFSPKFDQGTVSLLNTRKDVSYNDFTATIANPSITNITNKDGNLVWLSKPYPELYEKMQELMEKIRVITGYNYPATGVKNYTSGLADQLGATPDDDPYDNNPGNPAYQDQPDPRGGTANNCASGAMWDATAGKCMLKGYKGSITDVLTKYNNLTQTYQTLFAGLADENALEGVDKNYTILNPEETNIKFALIGKRCPVLAPSATSSPDLIANCPKFGTEYNMARRFIFEPDDTKANPTGLTTGFATNPFTGAKSSALAGILNLDEMATQLQVLPPDKNIIKLIRLRQLLEQLQVAPNPIPLPGKSAALNPNPLSGVDLIQVSLPGYEHIQDWLNSTSTAAGLPDKNKNIQELIAAYGYTNAKDAYPEISKQLDDIFPDITNQVTDKLKEVFLKRMEENLEQAKLNAQYRLERFIEYIRDINPLVKLEVPKQRGDQFLGFTGANIKQISSDTSLIQIDAEQMFTDGGRRVNELLSRTPLRLTNGERLGIIGSAIYKIKTLNKFLGIDISTAAFSAQIAQYADISGATTDEYNANLDNKVRMALKDVYMYYTGIFNQTDETLPPAKQGMIPTCTYDTTRAQYSCALTVVAENGKPAVIYKDAKTKLEELKNDFSLMVGEVSAVTEEFQTLISNVASQKMDMEDLVKLLSTMETDYNKANACVGLPTDQLWKTPGNISATLNSAVGSSLAGMITTSAIIGGTSGTAVGATIGAIVGGPLGALIGGGLGAAIGWAIGWFSGNKAKKKAREEAERREAQRQKIISDCKAGVAAFNKHLGQLADQFVCGKINPAYQD